jgi:hypothetical protein
VRSLASDGVAVDSLQQLVEEVLSQRVMLRESDDTMRFDRQWGLARESPQAQAQAPSSARAGVVAGVFAMPLFVQAVILDDIREADTRAAELSRLMRRYTEQHAGLPLLQLFILDLLGRRTNAALIFKEKFEEEFAHTHAVAVLLIVLGNVFFIYLTLLRAFVRGRAWQLQFLVAAAVQIAMEVALNQTLECIWLHYVVPSQVGREMRAAIRTLYRMAEDMSTAAPLVGVFLNAPSYLFASTNVAREKPALLESLLVLSYTSHLPG